MDGPRDFPVVLVENAMQARHFSPPVQWEATVVGPGVQRELVVRQFEQSRHFFNDHDCSVNNLPMPSGSALDAPPSCPLWASGSETTGGECTLPPGSPGWAIIQNVGPDVYPNANAQSVIFIAPSFRDSQNAWCEYPDRRKLCQIP